MNDRIRLAEWMGWKHSTIGTEYCWRNEDGRMIGMCPNPEHDANDCEALITHLRENEHISVTVTFGRGVRFDHDIGTHKEIETNDWKKGVFELALKVLSDGNEPPDGS